jgi:hypothetical protein
MRKRLRLLRRLRERRAPAPLIDDFVETPHVRLLTDRLPADDAWIAQLRSGPATDPTPLVEPAPPVEDDWADPGPGGIVLELRSPAAVEPAAFDAEPASPVATLEEAGARNLPARNLERLIFEVALRNEIVAQRVERIERRLDDLANEVFEAATQCDLIEVEARRARLACEVTRLSVELRAEIDGGLQRLAREMATLVAQRGEVDATPRPAPCPVALSQLADLDTMHTDLVGPTGPYAATAG